MKSEAVERFLNGFEEWERRSQPKTTAPKVATISPVTQKFIDGWDKWERRSPSGQSSVQTAEPALSEVAQKFIQGHARWESPRSHNLPSNK